MVQYSYQHFSRANSSAILHTDSQSFTESTPVSHFACICPHLRDQIRTHVIGIQGVSLADRLALRKRWHTILPKKEDLDLTMSVPGLRVIARVTGKPKPRRRTHPPAPREPLMKRELNIDIDGNEIPGLAPCLAARFSRIVDSSIEDLNQAFETCLGRVCCEGARKVIALVCV